MIFTLLVWMQLNGTTMLSVQPVAASQCGAMREAMLKIPGARAAICAGDPATPLKYVSQGECVLVDERSNYATFMCNKPAPKFGA